MSFSTLLVSVLTLIGRVLKLFQARQSNTKKTNMNDLKKQSRELKILKRAVVARKNARVKNRKTNDIMHDATTNSVQNDKYQRD